ncbi:hypothetical protein ACFV0O_32485 [Kitasatospora sp. NPDC059577]|uniref:hypothetical protein n=1 Tax=Kitasatospora sp. NPDC059577 TaxID=3346873 RepID=UPI00369E3CC6
MSSPSASKHSSPTASWTRRVRALTGHRLPALNLAAATGDRIDRPDPAFTDRAWTVHYCYPGVSGRSSCSEAAW